VKFDKIKYLEWMTENIDKCEYDLSQGKMLLEFPQIDEYLSKREFLLDASIAWRDKLLNALSGYYKVDSKQIFLVPSATIGLFIVLATFLENGDEVVLESPNYEPLYRLCRYLRSSVKLVERSAENNFQLDLSALQRRISRNTRLLLITNLHNPSSVAIDKDKMTAIVKVCRDYDALLVSDEVYYHTSFINDVIPAFGVGDNAITVSSLSKLYGVPITRLGWIIAPDRWIDKLRRAFLYFPYTFSSCSTNLSALILDNVNDILPKVKTTLMENLNILRGWAEKRKEIKWIEPNGGGNAFIRIVYPINSMEICNALKQKYGTLIVPGDFFWIKRFIRINFANNPSVLSEGLARISACFDNLTRFKRLLYT
jgi:aspartate/methionine/tyrosine aminotransferase